jgi:hypothetical protein
MHSNNINSPPTVTSPEVPLATAEQARTIEPSVAATTTIPESLPSLEDRTRVPRTPVDRTWAIRKTLIKAARKQELASLYKGIGNMLQKEADELNKRVLGI